METGEKKELNRTLDELKDKVKKLEDQTLQQWNRIKTLERVVKGLRK